MSIYFKLSSRCIGNWTKDKHTDIDYDKESYFKFSINILTFKLYLVGKKTTQVYRDINTKYYVFVISKYKSSKFNSYSK